MPQDATPASIRRDSITAHPASEAHHLEFAIARTRGCDPRPLVRLADLLTTSPSCIALNPSRAARLYQRAIQLGGGLHALNALGELLSTGAPPDLRPDLPRAARLWHSAAQGGYKPAMRNLAALLEAGAEGVAPDPARAVLLYKAIVDDPCFKGVRFNLAWLLSSSLPSVPQDHILAAHIYQQLVTEEGDVNAMFNLACVLSQGNGNLPQDNARAAELYKRAIAEANHACSMHNLGVLASTGDGIEKNIPHALQLLERAVEEGRREANFDLALVLANDDDGATPIDFPRAMRTYELVLHELDHMGAMINLAEVLWEGKHGVPRNVTRAMTLWENAIAQGLGYDGPSLKRLKIEARRRFDPIEDREAMQMCDHATSQGWHLIAMCNLAEMLLSGVVPRQVDRAMKLYETALTNPMLPEVCNTQELDFEDTFKVVREMLREEGGVERYLDYAIRIYELLVEGAQNSHAMFLLAEIYMHGLGNRSADTWTAVCLYRRAIAKGHRGAMLALGEILLMGTGGLPRDVGYAVDMFSRTVVEGPSDCTVTKAATVRLAQLYIV